MVDRDDDVRIGIKTAAIAFGRYDVAAVMVCYGSRLLCSRASAYITGWACLTIWAYAARGAHGVPLSPDPWPRSGRLLQGVQSKQLGRRVIFAGMFAISR